MVVRLGDVYKRQKPTYTERDGCIYVDFGQTSEGTAARTVSLPEADMLIADYMKKWLSIMTTQIRQNTLDLSLIHI